MAFTQLLSIGQRGIDMLNQYKTELPDLWESTSYIAEWLGGYLWVTDKVAGEERLTKDD
jgi:hypothetical protein